MDKNKILEKLVNACNALNSTTVSGIQNISNIIGCYTILQEVISELLSFENKPSKEPGEGKPPDKKR